MFLDDLLNGVVTSVETVFPGLKEERRPNDGRDLLESVERHKREFERVKREIEANGREVERDSRMIRSLAMAAFREDPEAERRAREATIARSNRIQELKDAFEKSGRSHNSAAPEEVETLLTLTEKKIIQQCRRPKCHGCKLGWICPKYWSES